jgi:hypothetical protein
MEFTVNRTRIACEAAIGAGIENVEQVVCSSSYARAECRFGAHDCDGESRINVVFLPLSYEVLAGPGNRRVL